MSIIAITGSLFAAKCGDSVTNRYTLITTERRNFQMLDGTATIVESSQSESLKIWLQSDFGENLASKLGIDTQRISRMRQALGVGYEDGGNRRSMTHDDAPDLAGRLKIVGGDAKQIIVLSAGIDTWQLVPSTQIILQPTAKPHLKRWLQQVSVDDAAAKLSVGKRQITEIKRLLNILRKWDMFKLIIFDLDGTLVHPFTSDFEPGVRYWFSHCHRREKLAICTNQGGIGLRHWREIVRSQGGDIGDPNSTGWTQQNMEERINALATQIDATPYISFAYQSKKGHWSPTPENAQDDPRWQQSWRKPQPGMLLQAMTDANVTPDQTLMVGNSDDDRNAAAAAGCHYSDHDEFFGPYRPHIVITYNPERCWSWLNLTDGINREATMRRYEAMLQRAAQIYGHTVEVKTKQSRTSENVRLIRSESPEHEARIIELVHGHIADRWIDREWIEFDTPEQHLDALIASDAIQQIVIASIVLRNIYGNDVTERCAAKFAEAEAHKRKFKIVLG